jgi:putative endopeptidase
MKRMEHNTVHRPATALSAAAIALLAAAGVATVAIAQTSGVNKANMDTSVSPCQDFYRYTNGKWMDTAVIPPSYTGIGAAREIADKNQEILRQVLEKAAANVATEKDPTQKKVGLFYSTLMDSARADKEGAAPIAEELKVIAAIKTPADLRAEFARMAKAGVGAGFGPGGMPFRLGAEPDRDNSSMNIGTVSQGGLGLPERDFYFRQDPKSSALRDAYVAYITKTLQKTGDDEATAKKNADAIMKLETALADSSMARVAMRDPHAIFHRMSVKELGALCPAIDWTAYFTETGVTSLASATATLNVSQPMFMRQVNTLITSTPIETWRAYLRFHMTRAAAAWLSTDFFMDNFAFQSLLTGQKEPLPRWKRASQVLDFTMGEAVGKAWVAVAFPPESKQRVLDMVNNLHAVMDERIAASPWMSEATKKQASIKLHAIMRKIGYPDKWRDYTAMDIQAGQSGGTMIRNAARFEVNRRLSQINKPVDRTEWGMTPPTVNAYYNPTVNEIVFPAGILQPPYFDPKADDAFNYGAVGSVIGHETTHGFDDEGRQFDAEGNLKDWWTADDATKFKDKAQKVVDQYSSYVAVDTIHVNGRLTLGENIADIGGLTIAFHAWQRSLHGKPAPVIDGMTGEQRFFLGYASEWRRKNRPETMRTAALTDPHSPAEWRVNGVVSDMPEFYKAFGCKDGDALVKNDAQRPDIW